MERITCAGSLSRANEPQHRIELCPRPYHGRAPPLSYRGVWFYRLVESGFYQMVEPFPMRSVPDSNRRSPP